jgi:hypothetical protein
MESAKKKPQKWLSKLFFGATHNPDYASEPVTSKCLPVPVLMTTVSL